jgi:hypothetical protein
MPPPPVVKARVDRQTPVQPVVVHSNATTSTATWSSCPGDEVFRSLVIANEELATSGYAKINFEEDTGDDASTYFGTLREVGEKLFDNQIATGLFLSMGPSRASVPPPLPPIFSISSDAQRDVNPVGAYGHNGRKRPPAV